MAILKSINSTLHSASSNNYDQICVVENIADMWVIESSGIYKGHYHILGGTSALLLKVKK